MSVWAKCPTTAKPAQQSHAERVLCSAEVNMRLLFTFAGFELDVTLGRETQDGR